MKDKSINNQTLYRGRKPTSGNVRLRPVFREEPDIEKLGRAIIAFATTNMDCEIKGMRIKNGIIKESIMSKEMR
ncbi:hypothetical protein AGMMS49975_12040 [Clostridia bacterium]|nr:hypothetical protein AGMMS49975_12040 [Clostridia bacterium]